MTAALTENPAVLDPRAALTPSQQDALKALSTFRHNAFLGGQWQVGDMRFSKRTIVALTEKHLVTRAGERRLALTTAGQLAADKLKGKPQ